MNISYQLIHRSVMLLVVGCSSITIGAMNSPQNNLVTSSTPTTVKQWWSQLVQAERDAAYTIHNEQHTLRLSREVTNLQGIEQIVKPFPCTREQRLLITNGNIKVFDQRQGDALARIRIKHVALLNNNTHHIEQGAFSLCRHKHITIQSVIATRASFSGFPNRITVVQYDARGNRTSHTYRNS